MKPEQLGMPNDEASLPEKFLSSPNLITRRSFITRFGKVVGLGLFTAKFAKFAAGESHMEELCRIYDWDKHLPTTQDVCDILGYFSGPNDCTLRPDAPANREPPPVPDDCDPPGWGTDTGYPPDDNDDWGDDDEDTGDTEGDGDEYPDPNDPDDDPDEPYDPDDPKKRCKPIPGEPDVFVCRTNPDRTDMCFPDYDNCWYRNYMFWPDKCEKHIRDHCKPNGMQRSIYDACVKTQPPIYDYCDPEDSKDSCCIEGTRYDACYNPDENKVDQCHEPGSGDYCSVRSKNGDNVCLQDKCQRRISLNQKDTSDPWIE